MALQKATKLSKSSFFDDHEWLRQSYPRNDEATMTQHGFPYDRRFMLLKSIGNGEYENMHVSQYSSMCLFTTALSIPDPDDLSSATVEVAYTDPKKNGVSNSITIPLNPDASTLQSLPVVMHNSSVTGRIMPDQYSTWFSSRFGFDVVLAHLGSAAYREVLGNIAPNSAVRNAKLKQQKQQQSSWLGSITSRATEMLLGSTADSEEDRSYEITFADCAPYLVVSDASVQDASSRLPEGQEMDVTKFRPNIVVAGAPAAFEEDFWRELRFNPSGAAQDGEDDDSVTTLNCTANCLRCASLNVDYATGEFNKTDGMLKKLQRDRRVDPGMPYSPCFGRYSFLENADAREIKVGDEVMVSKRNEARTVFKWPGLSSVSKNERCRNSPQKYDKGLMRCILPVKQKPCVNIRRAREDCASPTGSEISPRRAMRVEPTECAFHTRSSDRVAHSSPSSFSKFVSYISVARHLWAAISGPQQRAPAMKMNVAMAIPQPSKVFRVRELPSEADETYLINAINAQLTPVELDARSFSVLDVVPSCSDESRVGLIEFKAQTPEFLQALVDGSLAQWGIEYDDRDIFFDVHFYGLTQMYNTRPGLEGHAYDSWRGRGNLGRVWLRDFLSVDLPGCRTMTYGYRLNLSQLGTATLLDYGREFLSDVSDARSAQEHSQRPIIFIAHGFGGILLAHALNRASHVYSDQLVSTIYLATYGIIFFGVPHRGQIIEDIKILALHHEARERATFIEEIDRDSDFLYTQSNEVVDLLQDRRVVSFYETEGTRKLEFNEEKKRWERTGPRVTVVTSRSATLQLPQTMEDKYPLHDDHSNMVKFDSRANKGYVKTIKKLQYFEDDARDVVRARFWSSGMGIAGQSREVLTPDIFPLEHYVHRYALEERLENLFEIKAWRSPNNHHLVALHGPSGSGTTQLARNYAHTHMTDYKCIFWIYGRSTATVESDIRKHFQKMTQGALIEHQSAASFDVILAAFHKWFKNSTSRNLVIFDQVNSLSRSGPVAAIDLDKYIPRNKSTDIIVTSNCKDFSPLPGITTIKVGPMTEQEALNLFFESMKITDARETKAEEVTKIIHNLGCQPLAVALAGRSTFHMSDAGKDISDYLHRYHGRATAIAKHTAVSISSKWDQRTYAAWDLAFSELQQESRLAARLTALLGFVCDDEVRIDLFRWALQSREYDLDSGIGEGDTSHDIYNTSRPTRIEKVRSMFNSVRKMMQAQTAHAVENAGKIIKHEIEARQQQQEKNLNEKRGKKKECDRHFRDSGDAHDQDMHSDRSSTKVASSSNSDLSDSDTHKQHDDSISRSQDQKKLTTWTQFLTGSSNDLWLSTIEDKLDTISSHCLIHIKESEPRAYAMHPDAAYWSRQRYCIRIDKWMAIGFAALLFLRDASFSCSRDAESLNQLSRSILTFWSTFCKAKFVAGRSEWKKSDRYVKALIFLSRVLSRNGMYRAARDYINYAHERSNEHQTGKSTMQMVQLELRDLSLVGGVQNGHC
ncbi:hypothetical protein FH972_022980 [Carpinus fangiana]|uniref:MOSC domain-containing protein n=1 Tax=Carpinus fangiana TaxID=176857 RepID=A0A5N6KUB3_9ROSI|nr:hypothetical protein FH972_022980 [Carpinus fangiana]